MDIIVSTTHCPVENLAMEKKLMTERHDDILFLYINSPSVIIGRNQLPEAEADMEYCRQHDIPVIKRLSGGGAVYHDFGNINYSFIVNSTKKALDHQLLSPVTAALQSFGVKTIIGIRKDILVDNNKVSGTASHVTKGRQLFHGTLLFDTDPERMKQALNGDKSLRGRHIASVPSQTINLSEVLKTKMTTPQFWEQLICFFEDYFNTLSLYSCNISSISSGVSTE